MDINNDNDENTTETLNKENKPTLWQRILNVIGIIILLIFITCGKIVGRQAGNLTFRTQRNINYKNYLEEINKNLPMRIDDVTTIEKFDLIDNTFIYFYSIDKTVNFDNIDFNIIRERIKSNTPEKTKKMFKDFNKKIIYRYKSKLNGKTRDVIFYPNEFN